MINVFVSFYKIFFFFIPTLYVFRYVITNGREDIYTLVFILIIFVGAFYRVLDLLKRRFFIELSAIYYILFLMYISISMLWLEYSFVILSGLTLIIIYVSILIFSEFIIREKGFWGIYSSFSYGILFVSLLMKLLNIIYPETIKIIDNRFGWFFVNGHVVSDPNLYAVFLAISIPFFVIKVYESSRKYIFFILLLIVLYFLVATLSRGVMLAFIISCFITFTVWNLKRNNVIQYVLFMLLFMLVSMIVVTVIINNSDYLSDINQKSVERYLLLNTNERLPIWRAIITNFFDEELRIILFGHGFQSGSVIGGYYYFGTDGNFKNPHNMFIQVLMETGICGLVFLMFVMLIMILKVISSLRKKNYLSLYFFVLFITTNLSLNVMGLRELSFIFGTLLIGSFNLSPYNFQRDPLHVKYFRC